MTLSRIGPAGSITACILLANEAPVLPVSLRSSLSPPLANRGQAVYSANFR